MTTTETTNITTPFPVSPQVREFAATYAKQRKQPKYMIRDYLSGKHDSGDFVQLLAAQETALRLEFESEQVEKTNRIMALETAVERHKERISDLMDSHQAERAAKQSELDKLHEQFKTLTHRIGHYKVTVQNVRKAAAALWFGRGQTIVDACDLRLKD